MSATGLKAGEVVMFQHDLDRLDHERTSSMAGLLIAEAALADMAKAFEWGTGNAVGAGVGRCKVALAAVRAAIAAARGDE